MSKTKKTYPISEDMELLIIKYDQALEMRDLALKLPFGYRKALRAAVDSQLFIKKFWKRVHDVYPELKGKDITYDRETKAVVIKGE